MTEFNTLILKLLDEIDEFCGENDCSYFLAGDMALTASRSDKLLSQVVTPEIIMPLGDVLKLADHVNSGKAEGRCVESIFTNMKFEHQFFKYVAEDSLCFNASLDASSEALGIHVRIRTIKADLGSEDSDKADEMMKAWQFYHQIGKADWFEKGGFRTRLRRKSIRRRLERDEKGYYSEMLEAIRASQKNFSLDSKTYIDKLTYTSNPKSKFFFPEGFFKEYDMTVLDGHTYRMPKGIAYYLDELYSHQDLDVKEINSSKILPGSVITTRVPYAEFKDVLKSKGTDYGIFKELLYERTIAKSDYLKKMTPITDRWKIVQDKIEERAASR